VDHGHRLVSCDTSLVVSGGVDCGRRRQKVYDKKLTTDRHEASRGLFATAELLVDVTVIASREHRRQSC